MKTPEEIKRGLKCCTADVDGLAACGDCPYADRTVGCWVEGNVLERDALDYIRQLEAERDGLLQKLQQPHWISVDDRLPEDDKEVLVYAIGNDDIESTIALTCHTHRMYGYNIEGWVAPWQYFNTNYRITHWMPLPQPPKEEEHGL